MASEDLITKVSDHFFTDEFQGAVDAFITDHVHLFIGLNDAVTEDGEEHKLEYWSCYQEFVKLFESKMEEFLKMEGSSSGEFYRLCKQAATSGDEWGEAATFVNLLVATSDYGAFLELMKDEAKDTAERADRDAEEAEVSAKLRDSRIDDGESKK